MRPRVNLRAIKMCRVGSRNVAATECHAVERQGRVGCARVWAHPARPFVGKGECDWAAGEEEPQVRKMSASAARAE
jgi:hypothetical protein